MATEPAVFARLVPYLRDALRFCHGELSESPSKRLLPADRQQLWIALAGDGAELLGVILSEISEYPTLRVLRIVLLQGINFKSWSGHARVALEAFARENGCERLEARAVKDSPDFLLLSVLNLHTRRSFLKCVITNSVPLRASVKRINHGKKLRRNISTSTSSYPSFQQPAVKTVL
jgi:hypothetical protein